MSERNAKRQLGMDILPHVPYNADGGRETFAGVRKLGDATLVLVAGEGFMMVARIADGTGHELGHLKIGDPIRLTLTDAGHRVHEDSRKPATVPAPEKPEKPQTPQQARPAPHPTRHRPRR